MANIGCLHEDSSFPSYGQISSREDPDAVLMMGFSGKDLLPTRIKSKGPAGR